MSKIISNNDAFSDFSALSAHLDNLGLFRMRPGLTRVKAVLNHLGLLRPPFLVAQVAGTNGKGSAATMLAALAREHGLKSGLHTSPHLLSVRERIRIDGQMLDENTWTRLGNTLMAHGGGELTYFEFVTTLAVLAFARHGIDLAVMETGLGGRFDATTAMEADLLVFTPIDLDHQNVLGNSLAVIAADKAGAIRPGKPVLSYAQKPEAMHELRIAAKAKGSALQVLAGNDPLFADESIASLPLSLAGPHQLENARLALAAWRLLTKSKDFEGSDALLSRPPAPGQAAVPNRSRAATAPGEPARADSLPATGREAAALRRAWLPGRMHFIAPGAATRPGDPFAASAAGRPALLLDGAHNSHGLAALGLALAGAGIAPGAVIFSCLQDKDIEALLPLLRSLATGPVFVPPIAGNPRACEPAELARAIGLSARPTSSLAEALTLAARHMAERLPEAFAPAHRRNPLLICGSLYMLGEFYTIFPEFM
ncbi:bifunctional folylpolyglutamate synthase/dihydrofolate synthase, partial [Desulfovibrio sp. OttesenSCG-928-G11]|nr:bifunctional folylpolyglutamate synthase/dihydrofolate synthase [Desulfovibrio sp. OttesenSCG-928-G11]